MWSSPRAQRTQWAQRKQQQQQQHSSSRTTKTEDGEAGAIKQMRDQYDAMSLEELKQLVLQKGMSKGDRDKAGLIKLLLGMDDEVLEEHSFDEKYKHILDNLHRTWRNHFPAPADKLFNDMRREWIKGGELMFPTRYFGHCWGRIPRTIGEFNEDVEGCPCCKREREIHKDGHCHAHIFAAVVLAVGYV
jgi:hypothetical protein